MKIGVYPGSFNPPTVGHVAIVKAAIRHHELDRIDLVVSEVALAKPLIEKPSLDERMQVIADSFAEVPEVNVIRTSLQLIADIAQGYDVVVMGADKWAQVNDVKFYASEAHMQECLSSLPTLAVAPRSGEKVHESVLLKVPDEIAEVSSSSARETNFEWMTKSAQEFSNESGAWQS